MASLLVCLGILGCHFASLTFGASRQVVFNFCSQALTSVIVRVPLVDVISRRMFQAIEDESAVTTSPDLDGAKMALDFDPTSTSLW